MYDSFNADTIDTGAFCRSQRLGAVAARCGGADLYSCSKTSILQKTGMPVGIRIGSTGIGSSEFKNLF